MANEKPPGSPGARRKRPPTVIDLEASEVVPRTAGAEPPVEAAAPPPSDPPPTDNAFVPPQPDIPNKTPDQTPEQAGSGQASSEPPPPPPPPEPRRTAEDPPPGGRPFFVWPAAASAAGAAGGLVVVLLLWLAGAFSGGRDAQPDLTPRLAAIEQRLKDLAARPVPAGVDPKAVDELAARLTRIWRWAAEKGLGR